MLDNEKLNTQIDAYLRGEMLPSDKTVFEQQMEKDPLIQHELEMQQTIIQGIQHSRKLAMKASLNSMNVSLWSLAVSEALKVAAGLLISGALIGGGYYLADTYLSQNKPTSASIQIDTVESEQSADDFIVLSGENKAKEVANPAESVNNEVPVSQTTTVETNKELRTEPAIVSKTVTSKITEEPKTVKKPVQSNTKSEEASASTPAAPSLMEMDMEEPGITKSGLDNVPTGKLASTFKTDNIKPEVVYKKHNKDKFFYQYFSNKLTLYGNFDEIVYELLELNTNDGKKLYIYFNDKFFQINTLQTELTPLKEIADSSLVKELNYLRKKKVD